MRLLVMRAEQQYWSVTGPGEILSLKYNKVFNLNLITSSCTVYVKVCGSLCLHTSFVIFK